MAIEEVRNKRLLRVLQRLKMVQEFSIEIPDKEADAILSSECQIMPQRSRAVLRSLFLVDKAVNYILDQPDGTIL